jgi:hypothetical protein
MNRRPGHEVARTLLDRVLRRRRGARNTDALAITPQAVLGLPPVHCGEATGRAGWLAFTTT